MVTLGLCATMSLAPIAQAAHKKPKKQVTSKIDTIKVPQLKPGAPGGPVEPVEIDKKDLKNPTVIQHYFFSIQAPQGWSVVAAGSQESPNAPVDAMVSLTPTSNTSKDSSYLSVRTVYGQALPKTTADLYAIVSKDTAKQTRYVQLNGQQWIFSQYDTVKADGSTVKQYAVRTIVGSRGFLALAGTPIANAKTIGSQLLKILQTIKLSR
jgi:hypothetical protein